jgi:hypothetical protein
MAEVQPRWSPSWDGHRQPSRVTSRTGRGLTPVFAPASRRGQATDSGRHHVIAPRIDHRWAIRLRCGRRRSAFNNVADMQRQRAMRPNFHLLLGCNQRRAKVSSNYQIAFGLGALPNKKSYTRASCETHYGHDFVELRGV